MKGDFSKDTFDATAHYSSVRLQQGRVLLDADWNEQVEIERRRIDALQRDLVGPSGVPEGSDGFALSQVDVPGGRDFLIKPGRMYVDGLLCTCEEPVAGRPAPSYLNQPHFPHGDGPSTYPLGNYLFAYLEAFTRHLTVAEEPRLGDPAVGATATRTQTVWQVRIDRLRLDPRLPDWARPLHGPDRTGRLSASLPQSATLPTENGLFRIEVNQISRVMQPDGSQVMRVQCKWSRDNGSIVTFPLSITGDKATVVDSTGFRSGGYVEWFDEREELRSTPSGPRGGILLKCTDVRTGQLSLDLSAFPGAGAVGVLTFPDTAPRTRFYFWDGAFEFDAAQGTTVELGGVVRITLSPGVYQQGDYFHVTVRANAGILSPPSGQSIAASFIRRHFAPLAEILPGGQIRDLRPRFSPLSKHVNQTDRRLRLLRDRQDAYVSLRHVLVMDRRCTAGSDVTVEAWNDPARVTTYIRTPVTLYMGVQFEQLPAVNVSRFSASYKPSANNTVISLWYEKILRDQINLLHDTIVGAIDNAFWWVTTSGRIRPMLSISVLRDEATGDLHLFTTRYSDLRYRRYDAAAKRWQGVQNYGYPGEHALWSRPFPMLLDGKPVVLMLDGRRHAVLFLRIPSSPTELPNWEGASMETPWWFGESTFTALPRTQRPLYPIYSPRPTGSNLTGFYTLNGGRLIGCFFKDRAGNPLDITKDRRYPADWKISLDNPGFWRQDTRTVKEASYPNLSGDWAGLYPGLPAVPVATEVTETLERQYRDLNLEAPILAIWLSPLTGNVLFTQIVTAIDGDRVEAYYSTDGGLPIVPAIAQPVNRNGVLVGPTPNTTDSYRNRISVLQPRGGTVNGSVYADSVALWISQPVYAQRGSERVAYLLLATGLEPLPSRGRIVNRLWSIIIRETPAAGGGSTLQIERTLAFGPSPQPPVKFLPSLTTIPAPVSTGVTTNNPGDIQAVAFVLASDSGPTQPPSLWEMTLSNGTWSFVSWFNVLPPGVSPATPPSTVVTASGKVGCFLVGSDGHIYELGRQADGTIYVTDHDLPLPDDGIA